MLGDLAEELKARDIALGTAELHTDARALLERAGIIERIGPNMIFEGMEDALDAYEARYGESQVPKGEAVANSNAMGTAQNFETERQMGKHEGKKKNKDKNGPDKVVEASAPAEERSSGGYAKELARLQEEIAHLQAWVKKTGARIVIIFEGRDAAGKGGVIRRLTERVSPRVFRVTALPAPTEREKSQIYMQRYIQHLPAAGEVVIFDRSWYNRPGVERVMGFTSEDSARRFLELAPRFEAAMVESGIVLLKYFLDVSEKEQERRFRQRIADPLRQWKLSPMDVESYQRWWDYTRAYNEMIRMTDTEYAPGGLCRRTTRSGRGSTASRTFLPRSPTSA